MRLAPIDFCILFLHSLRCGPTHSDPFDVISFFCGGRSLVLNSGLRPLGLATTPHEYIEKVSIQLYSVHTGKSILVRYISQRRISSKGWTAQGD